MSVDYHGCLALPVETLAIDTCCIQDARFQNSNSVIRLMSPSNISVKFRLLLSGDPEAAASGVASIGITLSERAEASLLD